MQQNTNTFMRNRNKIIYIQLGFKNKTNSIAWRVRIGRSADRRKSK